MKTQYVFTLHNLLLNLVIFVMSCVAHIERENFVGRIEIENLYRVRVQGRETEREKEKKRERERQKEREGERENLYRVRVQR